jgi:hypothetical protein
MRLRATPEEIQAHPIRVGLRFSALFFPAFLLVMWLQGRTVTASADSIAFLIGLFAFTTLAFGYGLKLAHGWRTSDAS